MIRFCDKEICYAALNELNWQQMLNYFLDWHMDEKVYILDETGKFVGSVNYNALFGVKSLNAVHMKYIDLAENKRICIVTDYVVLDKTIWEKGREYFRMYPGGLLPVLNKEHQLVCFAWNDDEANREIRMLDELMDCDNALDFRTVYPGADCVTIQGCNELAFYLARYLRQTGMPVNLYGELWDKLGRCDNAEVPDYRNYIVYAEGCAVIQEEKGIRKSVSPEFECVDCIYEENIIRGIIGDTNKTFKEFLKSLEGRQLVILGIDKECFDAYDLLLGHGLDICAFVNDRVGDKTLFGKKILKRAEAMEKLKSPVFLEVKARYSAWGFGETDYYHYYGYKRNTDFMLLLDYTEIPKSGYLNIFSHMLKETGQRLVLTGDFWLCRKLAMILQMNNEKVYKQVCYCDVLEEEFKEKKDDLRKIECNEVTEKDICLLLLPEYVGHWDETNTKSYKEIIKNKYLHKAIEKHIVNMVEYPVDNVVFMEGLKPHEEAGNVRFAVKKIVLGSIEHHCGTMFFRGILDSHPEIIMMGYGYFNENLYYLCIRLAEEKKENILNLLWELYDTEKLPDEEKWEEEEKDTFNRSMEELLSKKAVFTSQDLFIMIHISYARAWSKTEGNISDMIIYWEPHGVSRNDLEDYAIWLGRTGISGHIINVVRNAYSWRGSRMKDFEKRGRYPNPEHNQYVFLDVLNYIDIKRKVYNGWKRMVVKFEDLKLEPEKELKRICQEWEIKWFETMLRTTCHGKQEVYNYYNDNVSNFDLLPVYRTYEEYFSVFDRFRIMLITGPWLRKNGYSCMSSLDFSRKELLEMFQKEFHFEKNFIYEYDEDKVKTRNFIQKQIGCNLWKVRRDEIMERLKGNDFQ